MKSKKFNILVTVLISSVLLLSACIGTVYAYLSASADGPTDSFQIAGSKNPKVSVSVTQEQPTQSIATASVTVPSAGYKVYVRAIVVVNWVNNGQICATPDGASYEVTADGWELHDDFYYYTQAVDSLSDSFKVTYSNIDGYDVQVQVICQTIQAVGTVDGGTDAAVFEAWDVNIG
jgi:hypothetical protein